MAFFAKFFIKPVDKQKFVCYILTVLHEIAQLANIMEGDSKLIFIDYHSRVPIYEQIKEQVIMLVNTGVYSPGDKLPSIRSLSLELNINVNTIKRAFSDLEHDGIVYSAQGRGIFVAKNPIGNRRIVESALEDIRQTVVSGKAKGVSREELLSLVDKIYEGDGTNDKD